MHTELQAAQGPRSRKGHRPSKGAIKKGPRAGDAGQTPHHLLIHKRALLLQAGLGNVDPLVKAPMATVKTTDLS